MSFANLNTLRVIVSSKSLIYIKNNEGPNTGPCGTNVRTCRIVLLSKHYFIFNSNYILLRVEA